MIKWIHFFQGSLVIWINLPKTFNQNVIKWQWSMRIDCVGYIPELVFSNEWRFTINPCRVSVSVYCDSVANCVFIIYIGSIHSIALFLITRHLKDSLTVMAWNDILYAYGSVIIMHAELSTIHPPMWSPRNQKLVHNTNLEHDWT